MSEELIGQSREEGADHPDAKFLSTCWERALMMADESNAQLYGIYSEGELVETTPPTLEHGTGSVLLYYSRLARYAGSANARTFKARMRELVREAARELGEEPRLSKLLNDPSWPEIRVDGVPPKIRERQISEAEKGDTSYAPGAEVYDAQSMKNGSDPQPQPEPLAMPRLADDLELLLTDLLEEVREVIREHGEDAYREIASRLSVPTHVDGGLKNELWGLREALRKRSAPDARRMVARLAATALGAGADNGRLAR